MARRVRYATKRLRKLRMMLMRRKAIESAASVETENVLAGLGSERKVVEPGNQR